MFAWDRHGMGEDAVVGRGAEGRIIFWNMLTKLDWVLAACHGEEWRVKQEMFLD